MVGLVLAAAVGCTGTTGDDPAAKIAWSGELCAAVTSASAVLATPPPVADPADPAAVRSAVETYLTSVTRGLTEAVDTATRLRSSPVTGGDAVAAGAASAYDAVRAPLDAALITLRGDPSAGAALTALAEVVPRITSAVPPEPLRVEPDSEFTRWAQQAPQCADVPALRR
ncbi:hypothetical protein [Actinokineospora spheciospongiae]|uniref:hypothetical protein n=1 Tax=Actinokineospora spheciospongiae TaxID=909613 RepID=UPI000D70E058|nr:hypothetical protein [Actinokineospora spheciospongiae]PWW65924.1 hypothetical protein DFQ13_102684 [Actinokineospora spheciospongiae]